MEAAADDKNSSKTTEREKSGAFGKIMCNLFNLCSFFGNLRVTEEQKTRRQIMWWRFIGTIKWQKNVKMW